MNLCNDGHEEVCFESRYCPACEVAEAKDKEIALLERANGDQLDSIHQLEQELREAKEAHE